MVNKKVRAYVPSQVLWQFFLKRLRAIGLRLILRQRDRFSDWSGRLDSNQRLCGLPTRGFYQLNIEK
jgi:hypothetical protein